MISKFYYFIIFMPFCLFAITTKFTIFTFSDFSAFDENEINFSNILETLKKEKSNTKNFLTVLNGDFISNKNLYADKGKSVIEFLNEIPIDIALFGNHELDIGIEELKKRIFESKFKWLAANVMGLSSTSFYEKEQTLVYDCEGVKVGVFGLIDFDEKSISGYPDFMFLPYLDVAKRKCNELKKMGAEVIIAITHMSISKDRILAKEIKDIDVILASHDSKPFLWYEDDILIYKTGINKNALNRIDIIIEKKQKLNKEEIFVYPIWKVIEIDNN